MNNATETQKATYRTSGPATSCNECGEAGIYGFDVYDTDADITRVLCSTCAAEVCVEPEDDLTD